MRRIFLWMGIAGLILALGISAVHARGHRGRRHHNAGPRFEALELTQEQKDQLKSVRLDGKKKMIQYRADMQLARIELKELLIQKSPNQGQVDKVVAKITSTQAKITESRVRQKLGMKKILTEEQLKKIEEMTKDRRGGGHFRNRRGPGMMRREGMRREGMRREGMGMEGGAHSNESDSRI